MKKKFNLLLTLLVFAVLSACSDPVKPTDKKDTEPTPSEQTTAQNDEEKPEEKPNKPSDFIPEGYKIFQEIYGDFNKDGFPDCILIIKGTNKKNLVVNDFGEKVDRNRRGIIALTNNKGVYKVAVQNNDCFSSEYEDGGVYFPPDLSFELKKDVLTIQYSHGRYGYWSYKFRYSDPGFELIGYDQSDNHGPLVQQETSINFLSKKKLTRTNLNEDPEAEDNFEEKWDKIKINRLIQLSEIKDFDELDMSIY